MGLYKPMCDNPETSGGYIHFFIFEACHTQYRHSSQAVLLHMSSYHSHTIPNLFISENIYSPSDMSVLQTHNIFVGSEPGHQTLNTLQYMIFKQPSTAVINNFKHELSDYNNV